MSTPDAVANAHLWQRAVDAHLAGRSAEAIRLCEQLLGQSPGHVPALHLRGVIATGGGDVERAITSLRQAADLDPDNVAVHSDLALALLRAQRFREAVSACQRALQRQAHATELWFVLGFAAGELNARELAQAAYRRAIELRPDHADAKANLARLLHEDGRTGEAIALYRSALADQPGHRVALNNVAAMYLAQGQLEESISMLRQVLRVDPNDAGATGNLGLALADTPAFAEGVAYIRRAYEITGDIAYRLKADLAIPPLLASRDEILEFRAGFERRLDALLEMRFTLGDPLAAMAKTNFFLAYHGLDDRVLQEKTARLYAQACPSLHYVAPALGSGRTQPGSRVRVGFVSLHLRDHTIGKLFRGLIANLDGSSFEVVVITRRSRADSVQEYFDRKGVAVLPFAATLEASRALIAQQRLDVLVFTDIGMDPFTYLLAFARLAPMQLAAWGHPVTTGIPTIDGYISHEHCEAGDTADQYSERLIRLPARVSYTYYCRPQPNAVEKSRRDFALPEGRTLYLCPHPIFKLHPDFFAALRRVLLEDPNATLVFVGRVSPEWSNVVRSRLAPAASADNVVFAGWLSPDDFVELMRICDVLLDSFHFGGGNTTAEALATGIPIVTLPGAYMRGRFTYAWLRRIGVEEGIATSSDDFVERALRFGSDAALRGAVRHATKANSPLAYEDMGSVRAVELELIKSVEMREL